MLGVPAIIVRRPKRKKVAIDGDASLNSEALKHLVDWLADLRYRNGWSIRFEFAFCVASHRCDNGYERGKKDDEAEHCHEAQPNAPEKDYQRFV